MRSALVSTVLAAFYVASSQGLQCYEGFNISIGGVPFYHGAERECSGKSECFSQELETKVFDTKVKVLTRYNGCISKAYSSLVTCENLFGPDSNLDPAVLFKMLPDLETKFDDLLKDFQRNLTQEFQELFSNGKGTESFIAGCYKFLENVGFNMEKARPLQNQLVKLFKLIFKPPRRYSYSNINDYEYGQQYEPLPEIKKILHALKILDVGDPTLSGNFYSYLGNFLSKDQIKSFKKSIYAPLVEKLPGLLKSILPESWKVGDWYDFTFEIMGNLNIKAPKKSAFDVINTMKKVVKIPEEYNKFLDPIMDSTPDLVEKMFQGDTNYAFRWSLQLLKEESMTNDVTKRLSAALEKLYAAITRQKPDGGVHMFITWIPGLYYNLFEGKKTEIDKAYAIIAKGIEAMDFQNPSVTLEKTKMSEFIIMMTNKTRFIYPMGSPDMGLAPNPFMGSPYPEYENNRPQTFQDYQSPLAGYVPPPSRPNNDYESFGFENYSLSGPDHNLSSEPGYEPPSAPGNQPPSVPEYEWPMGPEYEPTSGNEYQPPPRPEFEPQPIPEDEPYKQPDQPKPLPHQNHQSVITQSNSSQKMFPEPNKMKSMNDLVIINLSSVFYSLMPDSQAKLDAIFTTLIEGLRSWPSLDAGKIIENLIIDVGWKVPPEIKPMLDNLQRVLNTTYSFEGRNLWNFRIHDFRREVLKIIHEYEVKYPRSEIPQAVRGYLELVYKVLTEMPDPSKCSDMMMNPSYEQIDWNEINRCYDRFSKRSYEFSREIQKESNDVSIDMQFAIFKEMDYDSNPFFENLINSFPDFAVYIRLMRALDTSDVKALGRDMWDWIYDSMPIRDAYNPLPGGSIARPSPTPLTISSFVKALDASLTKVTSKLGGVTKELRSIFSPDSCEFQKCDEDLCNMPLGRPVTTTPFEPSDSTFTTFTEEEYSTKDVEYSTTQEGLFTVEESSFATDADYTSYSMITSLAEEESTTGTIYHDDQTTILVTSQPSETSKGSSKVGATVSISDETDQRSVVISVDSDAINTSLPMTGVIKSSMTTPSDADTVNTSLLMTDAIKPSAATAIGSDTANVSFSATGVTDQFHIANTNDSKSTDATLSMDGTTETTESTTSGSGKIRAPFLMVLLLFWLIKKLL